MSSHFLTDKSLVLESQFGGWSRREDFRAFAEPGVGPSYTRDRACEIERIALDLAIDPVARTLSGVARLRFRALAGQRGPWVLDLEDLHVDGVEDGAGAPIPFRHADGRLEIPEVAEAVVRYHGTPRRGLYFVGPTAALPDRRPEAWTQCQDEDAHFIFPCFDHPSVKYPFSIRVTAPAGFGVVSNGRPRLGEGGARDGDSWEFEQTEPMSPYLFSVVVMEMDTQVAEGDGIPLGYVVPAGTPADTVARVFGRTPRMIEFLGAQYGRYPWPRYDQVVVHDFIFGGMENISATTLTDQVLTDERAALDWDADDLIVHELAHQWFGDLLTCQDWSQAWLNEGWATYTETLWTAHDQGRDAAEWHLWEQLGAYLGEDRGRYRRAIVAYHFRSPIDLFDRHLYEKAALVLHTLRHSLGDAAFWAGVRLYLERHRFGTVHTRHFQRALEEATGRNLDGFFADWVLGAGHPAVEVAVAHADGLLSVTVKQTQTGDNVASVFRFPLVVRIDDREVRLNIDARERTWCLPCAEPPASVGIDPGFAVLADIKLRGRRSWWIHALRSDAGVPAGVPAGVVARIRAAQALAVEGSPQAIEALCSALATDPFWGVRAEIADLLATNGGDRAVVALLSALSDSHPKARRRVVAALGGVRRPEVVVALAALSVGGRADASAQVEGEVARSLARLRADGARAACEALLERESWSEVLRARGLEGLGQLRDPGVLDTLLKWTGDAAPMRARTAACAALARLGEEVEAARLPAVERLNTLAEATNFRVQLAAIGALGWLRDPRSLAVLGRVHASGADGRLSRAAWEAMRSIREGRTTTDGLTTLRRELEGLADDNRKLRDRVVRIEDRAPRSEAT